MRRVQVEFEEDLLAALDDTPDVREQGRSAVLQRITSDFLRERRELEIDQQYERAYAGVADPLGEEWAGWADEGVGLPIETRRDLVLHVRCS